MHLGELANRTPNPAVLGCYERLDASAPDDYRQLAALLLEDWRSRRISKAGIGGGQGAGKSTLGRLIVEAGEILDVRVQVLSIDDFYLTRAERERLAQQVHPLLATRGPPGTHAISMARRTLAALLRPGEVEIPRFDKGIDDRAGRTMLHGPADLVVLEGWCVGAGAAPCSESAAPLNALERELDADGRWRRFVNAALADEYVRLNQDLDALVFLQVPGLDAVRRWRLQQEGERPPAQRMTATQVRRFVAHYERITQRMLVTLPATADVVVELDDEHRVAGLRFAAGPP